MSGPYRVGYVTQCIAKAMTLSANTFIKLPFDVDPNTQLLSLQRLSCCFNVSSRTRLLNAGCLLCAVGKDTAGS